MYEVRRMSTGGKSGLDYGGEIDAGPGCGFGVFCDDAVPCEQSGYDGTEKIVELEGWLAA